MAHQPVRQLGRARLKAKKTYPVLFGQLRRHLEAEERLAAGRIPADDHHVAELHVQNAVQPRHAKPQVLRARLVCSVAKCGRRVHGGHNAQVLFVDEQRVEIGHLLLSGGVRLGVGHVERRGLYQLHPPLILEHRGVVGEVDDADSLHLPDNDFVRLSQLVLQRHRVDRRTLAVQPLHRGECVAVCLRAEVRGGQLGECLARLVRAAQDRAQYAELYLVRMHHSTSRLSAQPPGAGRRLASSTLSVHRFFESQRQA